MKTYATYAEAVADAVATLEPLKGALLTDAERARQAACLAGQVGDLAAWSADLGGLDDIAGQLRLVQARLEQAVRMARARVDWGVAAELCGIGSEPQDPDYEPQA